MFHFQLQGSLITEDDCLLQPAELVELMIHFRLQSLSQEDYPAEDRLGMFPDLTLLNTMGSYVLSLNFVFHAYQIIVN